MLPGHQLSIVELSHQCQVFPENQQGFQHFINIAAIDIHEGHWMNV